MAYQPNIPTGSVPLNQDYLSIKGNFQELNTQFLVDHVPLTDTSGIPPNGYHTFVHLVPFTTPTSVPPSAQPVVTGVSGPAATAGFGQLFTVEVADGFSTDSSLYFLSGGGLLTQLTRNFQPLAVAAAGYTFLPGGLLLQWGTDTKFTGGTTTFPKAFTAAAFAVVLTPTGVTPSANGIPAAVNKTSTGFNIGNATGLTQSYTYQWMAIGI